MKRSPILSPEDVSQEHELQKLLRPERFRRWNVSRTSIANELIRREYGRNRERMGPESLGPIDTAAPPERCRLETEETARSVSEILRHLPDDARRIAIAIMGGTKRAPSRNEILKIRQYFRGSPELSRRLRIALTGTAD